MIRDNGVMESAVRETSGVKRTVKVDPLPFTLDVGVAKSPLMSTRFLLSSRVAELGAMIERLELNAVETAAQRAAGRTQLKRFDRARKQLVAHASTENRDDAIRSFASEMDLREELATLEQRAGGLQRRIRGLEEELSTLRALALQLRTVPDPSVNLEYQHAVRRVERMVDEEFEVIARKVTEGPLQDLVNAAMGAEVATRTLKQGAGATADEIARCKAFVRDAAQSLAEFTAALAPMATEQEGPSVSLRELCARYATTFSIRLDVFGNAQWLQPAQEVSLLRIVEEALENAANHSRAQNISVVVSYGKERCNVVVRDDGDGFDIAAAQEQMGRKNHAGIIAMQERAEGERGRVKVNSAVGVGTEVRVMLPARAAG